MVETVEYILLGKLYIGYLTSLVVTAAIPNKGLPAAHPMAMKPADEATSAGIVMVLFWHCW
jgi:hypothetical protein